MNKAGRTIRMTLAAPVCIAAVVFCTGKTVYAEGISYINAAGETQPSVETYTQVRSTTTEWTNGWYVADGNVTISDRITVKGTDVNLILCDNAVLSAESGIFVRRVNAETVYKLTISAQSTDHAGSLIAVGGRNAGIGGGVNAGIDYEGGNIVINGGSITASGKPGIDASG